MTPARRRNTSPLEEVEQLGIRKIMLACGAVEYVLGTKRRKTDYHGTMQTPGVADLQFFLPLKLPIAFRQPIIPADGRTRRFVVVESKRQKGGRFSPEQIQYRELCLAAGLDYIGGCLNDVIVWLVAEGYLDPKNLPHYRLPAGSLDR